MGMAFSLWLEDHSGCPGRERICLQGLACPEFLGPPPLPAPKAWLEHKGPLCGGLISKPRRFSNLWG